MRRTRKLKFVFDVDVNDDGILLVSSRISRRNFYSSFDKIECDASYDSSNGFFFAFVWQIRRGMTLTALIGSDFSAVILHWCKRKI